MNSTEIKLPGMTVEKRTGRPWRVPKPDLSPANMAMQIEDALKLNNDAKLGGWTNQTIEILEKHITTVVETDGDEIIEAIQTVLQVRSLKELALWVRDDACSEIFNRMLKYCLREGQKHKNSLDFIDGSGQGYLNAFSRNLKPNLEKTFDVKWHYKVKRPLQYVFDNYDGMDLRRVANHIHPGHWSYCQGHATKSLTSVQTQRQVFHLDEKCDKHNLIAALGFGHGRDANFIHYPMDTYASGFNTSLKEWK